MNRKNILILALIFASVSLAPASLVKAKEIKPEATSTVICGTTTPVQGITTNKLNPYVLNEKEVQTALGRFSKEIENLKHHEGYYVFDNAKYGIKDSEVYVMISLGERNTTGYGIKILSAEDIEGISKITIQETKPSTGTMVGEAITYPYVIVKFAQGTPKVKVLTDKGTELPSLVDLSELENKDWKSLKPCWDVPEDKEWLITFKKDISKTEVNDNTIYVRDSNGGKIPAKLVIGEDNKTVKVVPVEKYASGQTYFLFISDKVYSQKDLSNNKKGYRMSFSIKGNVTVGDSANQKANSCVVPSRIGNAPIFDASTNQQVGVISKDFSINLNDIRDGKVYFSLPVTEGKDNVIQKQYYVPIKYLDKAYKEPLAVPLIISTDMIKIKENASIYTIDNGVKQLIMKTSKNVGPMHYIMKTENGYQFVLANNVVYVQPEDVELIKE